MTNDERLKNFIVAKRLEGCSEKTLKFYEFNIKKLFSYIDKNVIEITTQDLRDYLIKYKEERQVSNVTLDNMRCVLQSFFNYLYDEGLMEKNPTGALKKIKSDQIIKNPFTEEELEILRENCRDIREKAIFEVLYSSGMRVGELTLLNIKDIDFINNKAIIFGKGAKEREAYFTVKARMLIQDYLKTRKDDNEALFVSLLEPHNRLEIAGVEIMLRKLGRSLEINKVHP